MAREPVCSPPDVADTLGPWEGAQFFEPRPADDAPSTDWAVATGWTGYARVMHSQVTE